MAIKKFEQLVFLSNDKLYLEAFQTELKDMTKVVTNFPGYRREITVI